jgi:DNA (cytosine-5)-methyltransferase 1
VKRLRCGCSPYLIADLFCGAGGSSTGARRALAARRMRMRLVAVNHWQTAVDTHTANHPEAEHFCVDVYKTSPREAVPGGRLDLLMASPTCTYHSRARGGKPISRDQKYGRMTPTQVLRWLRELDVRALLIENVPEFEGWCPVHPEDAPIHRAECLEGRGRFGESVKPCVPGKTCRTRAGDYFRAWVRRIEALGYRVEWRVLCAADFGDATTRQRFFLLARKDGRPIVWPTPTHAKTAGRGLKRWRGAREVIDWSLSGRSIFGRKKSLSPKTLKRIYAGAVRFGWPKPFLVAMRERLGVDEPLPEASFAEGAQTALFEPAPSLAVLRQNADLRDPSLPAPTICAGGGHLGLVEPVVFGNRTNNVGKDTAAPVPTITTATGGGVALAEPIVFQVNQGGDRARNIRGVDSPMQTVVTRPSLGVAQPLVTRTDMHKSNALCVRGDDEPIPTVTTGGGLGLLQPLVLPQGGGGAARPVLEPMATVTTDGAHALIAPYYGTGVARPTSDPLPTVTTRDRFGMVMPVTHHDGSARQRALDVPLPTITSAHRGELAVIVPAFGERKGQAPRTHDVDAPTPAICATGHIHLAEGRAEPEVDVLFRMLRPHELAAAMGFSDEEPYVFTGNQEEVTRQIGNAVPVNTAAALVGAVVDADERTPCARCGSAVVA